MSSTAPVPALERRAGIGDVLQLDTVDGASAVIAAHGAHVISWIAGIGGEQLFLSRRAEFGHYSAIRGGVPVIFPQFAGEGPLPKHGFLRNRPWQLVRAERPASNRAEAVFRIEDDAETRAIWPHAFRAELSLQVGGDRLETGLAITNTGTTVFGFTAALHSYLLAGDVSDVRIEGLQGLRYRDSAAEGAMAIESAAQLALVGEVDRIYFDAPPVIELIERRRRLRIESTGFRDAVVWNPGEIKAAGLADLDADGWRRFVCIESAAIGRPVELEPGQSWRGVQTLIAG